MGLTVIAIDGPAGSGKSTVARAVAERLGLDYLDTGAMYRSVAFAALRRRRRPGRRRRRWPASSATLEIDVDGGRRHRRRGRRHHRDPGAGGDPGGVASWPPTPRCAAELRAAASGRGPRPAAAG